MAYVQQPLVKYELETSKDDPQIGPGYVAGTFSAQDLQIWSPLPWASEDMAFMSLNLAPKVVTAFGKKSQFYILALFLSPHPMLGQGQEPRVASLPGRHLLLSSPALSSSVESWEGSVSPSHTHTPSHSPHGQETQALALSRPIRVSLCVSVWVFPLSSHDVCSTHSQKHTCMKPEDMRQGPGDVSIL